MMSGSPPRRRASRVLVGLGVGVGLGVTALVATPALGAVLDDGGQPPAQRQPGYVSPYVPESAEQPPAESQPDYVSPYVADSVQPANPDPQPAGSSGEAAPDEPGAAHPGPTVDEGDPNASSPPE